MADTEIDWTFEEAPTDDAPITPARGAGTPPNRRPAVRPAPGWLARVRRHRRLLIVLGLVLGLAAGALAAAEVIGWQRLRAQLAHDIAYEDEQARAGNVNTVAGLLGWSSPAWRDRRLAEVGLGLAAALPAETLRPLAEPPQLLSVDSVVDGDFTAEVARRYTDSAGQVYRFTLTQRYRNRGPGLWERQPPDEAALAPTAAFTGQRISATYPEADAAWMQTALPQVDAYLSAACANWRCPLAARVQVSFTAQIEQLPRLHALRSAVEPQPAGGYPLIFDLPFRNPRYPPKLVLASPQLGGVPADAAAGGALVRAYTADFLGRLAADLVVSNRTQHGYYFDALVARMEIRLGLAPLPPPVLAISAYTPPAELWPDVIGYGGGELPPELSPRLQALWFLNAALAGQSPDADAALLAGMRWQPTLASWLESSLPVDGAAVIANYEAEVQAQWTATPPDWDSLAGLAYSCGNTAGLVQGGALQTFAAANTHWPFAPPAVSLDGSFFAFTVNDGDTWQLQVVDLTSAQRQTISIDYAWPIGWSADGQLAYLTRQSADGYHDLHLFNPRSGITQRLTADAVTLDPTDPAWSSDHRALGLSFFSGPHAGVLTFDSPPQVFDLVPPGYTLDLSANGQWLAYTATSAPANALNVLDLETQVTYQILTANGLLAADSAASIDAVTWSPDGARLAITTRNQDGLAHVFLLTLRDGTLTGGADLIELSAPADYLAAEGFSADGRYLSIYSYAAERNFQAMLVYDTTTGALVKQLLGGSAAWAPRGQQLAVTGEQGLYIVDLATGREQWLAGGACVVSWSGVS